MTVARTVVIVATIRLFLTARRMRSFWNRRRYQSKVKPSQTAVCFERLKE